MLPLATFDTAWSIIARSHWDSSYNGVDWNAVRDSLRPRAEAAATQGDLRQVLQAMVLSLGQSHFAIIPQEVSDVASGTSRANDAPGDGQVGVTPRWIDGEVLVAAVARAAPRPRRECSRGG